MKEFRCDICGLAVDQYNLTTLYPNELQTDTIKDVCDDCYRKITAAKLKIESVIAPLKTNWMKSIIAKLKT